MKTFIDELFETRMTLRALSFLLENFTFKAWGEKDEENLRLLGTILGREGERLEKVLRKIENELSS
jgi:hypothetical protein